MKVHENTKKIDPRLFSRVVNIFCQVIKQQLDNAYSSVLSKMVPCLKYLVFWLIHIAQKNDRVIKSLSRGRLNDMRTVLCDLTWP